MFFSKVITKNQPKWTPNALAHSAVLNSSVFISFKVAFHLKLRL